MLSRTRLLTPTSKNLAKLVAGSNTTPLTSVSLEWARTLPPAAPPPPSSKSLKSKTKQQRKPIPIPSSTTPLTNDKQSELNKVEDRKDRDEEAEDDDEVRLKDFFLRTLTQLDVGGGQGMTVQEIIQASQDKAGTILEDVSLPYESTPTIERRVRTDGGVVNEAEEQDGIVLVAHVVGGDDPKVNVSSGFAVGGNEKEKKQGSMILTCCHTLNQIDGHLSKTTTKLPSATFVLTSSGHIFTISSLLSSLPSSDLLLLRLSQSPVDSASTTSPGASTSPPPPLRSLPINPYPSPTSTIISTHAYLNPLSRLSRKIRKLPERNWQRGRIVEYKDSIGRTAETGTYDELSSFWMSSVPEEGSSGGPVIEVESGSVVGVTRGSTHKYGERTSYGFATPAERILDMFSLPGFKTAAQQQLEAEGSKITEEGVEVSGRAAEGEGSGRQE